MHFSVDKLNNCMFMWATLHAMMQTRVEYCTIRWIGKFSEKSKVVSNFATVKILGAYPHLD